MYKYKISLSIVELNKAILLEGSPSPSIKVLKIWLISYLIGKFPWKRSKFVNRPKVWPSLSDIYCLIKSGTEESILINISTMLIFIKSLIELLVSLFYLELSSINLLNIGKIPFSHKTS